MNESVTVRSEERGIYTLSRNLTVQIYVRSSNTDLGTSDVNRKHCTQRVRSQRVQVSVGTPGKRRDFRRSEVPTNIGTFDVRSKRNSQHRRCRDSRLGSGQCWNSRRTSGLPTVGTLDERRDFRRAQTVSSQKHRCRDSWQRSGLPTVGSSDLSRDFRHRKSQKKYSMCS